MQRRERATFATIQSEGALLPMDVLQRIAQQERDIAGLSAEAYYHEGYLLNEVVNDAWTRALRAWKNFQTARATLPESNPGMKVTLERWLLPLFSDMGFGRLYNAQPIDIEQHTYPISHRWHNTPIHLVSCKAGLEQVMRNPLTNKRTSPYSLVQELLNRSDKHLWGLVSNGLRLRILRKNASLTRQSYIEFDLEAMMNGEVYADFTLFWLLCHVSRFEAEKSTDCWLEKWTRASQEQGFRVLDQLRNGVEQAINALGSGFLAHPANHELRQKLREGRLAGQEYYRQVLRMVYRMIILFVAEDRDVLLHPQAEAIARQRYLDYYSTSRLRRLAEQRIGTRHSDLFRGLYLVMEKLGSEEGYPGLALPALNGFLFSAKAIPDLVGCELANHELLGAIRELAFTSDGNARRSVDYRNLGSEELGSVYESLLELHPEIDVERATFVLKTASGNERKTSGSYYTPTSLINCLLDSALEPVLKEAYEKGGDAEKAILNLKVCDPACGSGHFLIAAAHRIAKRLAAVRTGTEEPALEERRAALRDVIGHCIYGVDINPMSVELCKVNLWMEALEPGKPLSFLDAHIQCGNSLLGTTPFLLAQGLPDSAFEPIEGDDKKVCSEYKKKNKQFRAGQLSWLNEKAEPWENLGDLATSMMRMDALADDTVEGVRRKQEFYEKLVRSGSYEDNLLLANAWCAAFVWKKVSGSSPITDETLRGIRKNPRGSIASWQREEIERIARQYQFFHWHLAFPDVFRVPTQGEEPENAQTGWSGGFDVVLGNPPWERIKIQEKEWFATRNPAIANAANAAQRRKLIAALEQDDPTLYAAFSEDLRKASGESHLLRNSARYPLCGRGDINTYAVFAENMRHVVSSTGRVGCIVPSGIATDDTTKFFFQDLMEKKSLHSLYGFENREKLFPTVDSRYNFSLLTISGTARPAFKGTEFVFFAQQVADVQDGQRRFTLTASDIKLLNPNTRTCPIFRSKHDMEITRAIYQRTPVLLKEGLTEVNPWSVSFSALFHMANTSHLFHTYDQLKAEGWQLQGNIFYKANEKFLPLYEGKMIWQFDHRFSSYQANSQETQELSNFEHRDTEKYLFPRYWVHQTELTKRLKVEKKAFLVFRDIARSTDNRTAIFSVIPSLPCGDTLHATFLGGEAEKDNLYFLSTTSSFVFDYATRQKIGGTHLKYFLVRQLPMLPPEHFDIDCQWERNLSLGDWIYPRALELTYTAWDLEGFAKDCSYDGPPFRWDEARRFLLRCELDAAYFHLYGIQRDDVDYIMETFPIVKRDDEKQYGEYRTKRVILAIYDEMQRAMESGEAYQTRLDPPPADPRVAHPPREVVEAVEDRTA